MWKSYRIEDLKNIMISWEKPKIVFLYGDLGLGKTTFVGKQIQKLIGKNIPVTSPTYVYYNRYQNHYHFDLYRISNYEEFIAIGGEEILDNNGGIIFIEWPQILEPYYTPDIKIFFEPWENDDTRSILIQDEV